MQMDETKMGKIRRSNTMKKKKVMVYLIRFAPVRRALNILLPVFGDIS